MRSWRCCWVAPILRYDARGAGLSQKGIGRRRARRPHRRPRGTARSGRHDGAGCTGRSGGRGRGGVAFCRPPSRPVWQGCSRWRRPPACRRSAGKRRSTLADRFEREGVRGRVLERIDRAFPARYRTDPARFEAFRGRMLAMIRTAMPPCIACSPGWIFDADLALVACPVLVLAGDTDQTRPAALVRSGCRPHPGRAICEVASATSCRCSHPGLGGLPPRSVLAGRRPGRRRWLESGKCRAGRSCGGREVAMMIIKSWVIHATAAAILLVLPASHCRPPTRGRSMPLARKAWWSGTPRSSRARQHGRWRRRSSANIPA